MTFSLRTLVAILVLPLILFSSCAQTEISKLEGNWRLFWINDLADPDIYVWQFEGGELTIIQYEPPSPVNPNPQPIIAARAQYKTSTEFLKAQVSISGHVQSVSAGSANQMLSNGVWFIDKIDNEVLRLSTTDQAGSNGSYVTREFTRED